MRNHASVANRGKCEGGHKRSAQRSAMAKSQLRTLFAQLHLPTGHSGNSKAEVGAASIIMPRCASRPTASWSPRGRRFPPVDLVPPRCSKNLPFPTVTDPEAPPLRTERHVPNSIATMRRRLIVALAKTLARCPCCAAPVSRSSYRNL